MNRLAGLYTIFVAKALSTRARLSQSAHSGHANRPNQRTKSTTATMTKTRTSNKMAPERSLSEAGVDASGGGKPRCIDFKRRITDCTTT